MNQKKSTLRIVLLFTSPRHLASRHLRHCLRQAAHVDPAISKARFRLAVGARRHCLRAKAASSCGRSICNDCSTGCQWCRTPKSILRCGMRSRVPCTHRVCQWHSSFLHCARQISRGSRGGVVVQGMQTTIPSGARSFFLACYLASSFIPSLLGFCITCLPSLLAWFLASLLPHLLGSCFAAILSCFSCLAQQSSKQETTPAHAN